MALSIPLCCGQVLSRFPPDLTCLEADIDANEFGRIIDDILLIAWILSSLFRKSNWQRFWFFD